jgi:hypothetical protein
MNEMFLRKCQRCGGATVQDKFYGLQEQFWGVKCVICGEVVDPVILENRQLMRASPGMDLRKARR